MAVHMQKKLPIRYWVKNTGHLKTFKRDVSIFPKNVFVLHSTCLYVYVCIFIYKHTTKIYTLSQRQNKNYELLSISEICIHFRIAVLSMLYVMLFFITFPISIQSFHKFHLKIKETIVIMLFYDYNLKSWKTLNTC